MRRMDGKEMSSEENDGWPGGRLREAEKAARQESKIKSVVAIYLVLVGMAAFVYLLIKLPTGGLSLIHI